MQILEQLEQSVSDLAAKCRQLHQKNMDLGEEIIRLTAEQQRKDAAHQAELDELGEALLVQVEKLKGDLQDAVERLTAENRHYKKVLAESMGEIARLKALLRTAETENA